MFHLLLALGWSTQQPTWQVWFGEGRGTLSSTVRDWPAPVGHLSLSDEGDANAFLCLPEEVSPPNNVDPGEWNVETFVTEALVQFNAAESHGSASGFSAYTYEAQPIEEQLVEPLGSLAPGCWLPPVAEDARVRDALQDIDADGRVDVFLGSQDSIYLNRGYGFSGVPLTVPAWIPHDEDGASLSSTRTWTLAVAGQNAIDLYDESFAETDILTLYQVVDIDQDGLLDLADRRTDSRGTTYGFRGSETFLPTSDLLVGNEGNTRPGLLHRVIDGNGGTTRVHWGNSATQGDVGEELGVGVYTPTHQPVVVGVTVADTVTGWKSRRVYAYEDGVHVPGQFLGFAKVDAFDYVAEPYGLLDVDDPDPKRGWWDNGQTHSEWELDPVHSLAVSTTYYQSNAWWWQRGSAAWSPRWKRTSTYTPLVTTAPGFNRFVPNVTSTTVYGSTSETWTDDVDFDTTGRVVQQLHGDASGNTYRYSFDGAGRTRFVHRRFPTQAPGWTQWYTFDWTGPDPWRQVEGTSATAAVTWTYDALGRTTSKAVRSPVAGQPDELFGWVWDTGWIGARAETTDPSGNVVYEYAAGPFGQLGHVTRTTRTTGTSIAVKERTYGLTGQVWTETWPSGAVVDHDWAASGELVSSTLTAAGLPVTTATMAYDGGWPAGWDLTQGAGQPSWHQDDLTQAGRPSERTWTHTSAAGAILGSQTYELGFSEGGRLELKKFDPEPLTYTYDGLGRIARVVEGVPATGANLETYTRDPAGNPTQVRIRDGGGTLRTWTYAATVTYNEIPSRALSGGATDTFTYQSPSGRLATWNTSGGGPQRTFAYDGSGRLRTASGEAYHYDVDDGIVLETRVGGVTIHRHDGWEKRQQVANGAWEVTESVLPMAALRDGALVVLRKEPDGHALQTHTPTTSSQEALGAFGLRLSGLQSNPDTWVVDGFHGEEVNRSAEVVHKGARHLALRDGMWLQPEPLLYLGLTNGNLKAPLGYSGVYAAGDSNHLQDPSGYDPIWMLTIGAAMAGHDVTQDPVAAATDPATYVGAIIATFPALGVASCDDPNLVPAVAATMMNMAALGDAAAGFLPASRPVVASEAVQVSRWGRPGLEAGDWVMRGGPTRWNYFWSGKWQPGFSNELAPFSSGQTFRVPSFTLQRPQEWGPVGVVKGLLGQRRFVPPPALPPPPPLLPSPPPPPAAAVP